MFHAVGHPWLGLKQKINNLTAVASNYSSTAGQSDPTSVFVYPCIYVHVPAILGINIAEKAHHSHNMEGPTNDQQLKNERKRNVIAINSVFRKGPESDIVV